MFSKLFHTNLTKSFLCNSNGSLVELLYRNAHEFIKIFRITKVPNPNFCDYKQYNPAHTFFPPIHPAKNFSMPNERGIDKQSVLLKLNASKQ